MQNRRHFLKAGVSVAAAGLTGAGALTGAHRTLAEEAPPETTSLRLPSTPRACLAPLDILDDLLREEGFADIRYCAALASAPAERRARRSGLRPGLFRPHIVPIDAGAPMVMLAGVHPGCFELVARESIRSVVDLKGRKWGWAGWRRGGRYCSGSSSPTSASIPPRTSIGSSKITAFLGSSMARPRQSPTTARTARSQGAFAKGEIDAFLTVPPWAQELRARNFGHVILNSTLDRPWSQYFCCMLIGPPILSAATRSRPSAWCAPWSGRPTFVPPNPIGSRSAWSIAALQPRYDYTRQGLDDVSYRNWREYDPEDAVRFYALRLRELGMIKSSPDTIIATGHELAFLKEVRKELGI